MTELAELQKGTKVWVISVLKKGEFCTRAIYDFENEIGEGERVLLSKFKNMERSYAATELITDESEARQIQIEALRKQENEIRAKKEKALEQAMVVIEKNRQQAESRLTAIEEKIEIIQKTLKTARQDIKLAAIG